MRPSCEDLGRCKQNVDAGACRDFRVASSELGHDTEEQHTVVIQTQIVGREEYGCHNTELYLFERSFKVLEPIPVVAGHV